MTSKLEALSPEQEFICQSVRPDPEFDRIETLAESDLDWDSVYSLAYERHRVVPQVHKTISSGDFAESIPESVRERFADRAHKITQENLSLTHSLLSLLDRFDAAGIPAIPFKGPVLAQTVYGDFTHRQHRDLDVVVPESRLRAAESVLEDLGFQPKRTLAEQARRIYGYTAHHREFRKGGTIIELHWHLSKPWEMPYTVEGLSEEQRPLSIAGQTVQAPTMEDHLILACIHGSGHQWGRLRWLCDIAHLVAFDDLDWGSIERVARQRGCRRRVLLGVALSGRILGIETPVALEDGVHSRSVQGLVTDTYPKCISKESDTDGLDTIHYRFRTLERYRERFRYALWLAFAPTMADYNLVRFPPILFRLYHLVHILRGADFIGRNVAKRLRMALVSS